MKMAPPMLKSRFIPTYVGHTDFLTASREVTTVHPHIRGAYTCSPKDFLTRYGSSPHTWGILYNKVQLYRFQRFIPTYVGHTSRTFSSSYPNTVHPHIRGAYKITIRASATGNGSSPHTWGIRLPVPGPRTPSRFIPTYVGHTKWSLEVNSSNTVHPHIRGAYSRKLVGGFCVVRFIPTYVGHTYRANHCIGYRAVHPHIRGAY